MFYKILLPLTPLTFTLSIKALILTELFLENLNGNFDYGLSLFLEVARLTCVSFCVSFCVCIVFRIS